MTSPTAALRSAAPWVYDVTFSPLIEMIVSPTCRPAPFAAPSELRASTVTGGAAPFVKMPHVVSAVGLLKVTRMGPGPALVCE